MKSNATFAILALFVALVAALPLAPVPPSTKTALGESSSVRQLAAVCANGDCQSASFLLARDDDGPDEVTGTDTRAGANNLDARADDEEDCEDDGAPSSGVDTGATSTSLADPVASQTQAPATGEDDGGDCEDDDGADDGDDEDCEDDAPASASATETNAPASATETTTSSPSAPTTSASTPSSDPTTSVPATTSTVAPTVTQPIDPALPSSSEPASSTPSSPQSQPTVTVTTTVKISQVTTVMVPAPTTLTGPPTTVTDAPSNPDHIIPLVSTSDAEPSTSAAPEWR